MAYTISTLFAIYFVLWWVTLFVTLPFGVRSQHEVGEVSDGTDPGAPTVPHLGRKLIWTTIVAACIYAACYVVYVNRLVTLEGLAGLFGMR